jgi:hypothetical protein
MEAVRLSVPLSIGTGQRVVSTGVIATGGIEPLPLAKVKGLLKAIEEMESAGEPRFTKSPGQLAMPRPVSNVTQELACQFDNSIAVLSSAWRHRHISPECARPHGACQGYHGIASIQDGGTPPLSPLTEQWIWWSNMLQVVVAPLNMDAHLLEACLKPN